MTKISYEKGKKDLVKIVFLKIFFKMYKYFLVRLVLNVIQWSIMNETIDFKISIVLEIHLKL